MSYVFVGYFCFGSGVLIGLLIGYWLAAKNGRATDGVAAINSAARQVHDDSMAALRQAGDAVIAAVHEKLASEPNSDGHSCTAGVTVWGECGQCGRQVLPRPAGVQVGHGEGF